MTPWQILETVSVPEGKLQLRRRGERSFLITIDGRTLMTSGERRSEEALASLACAPLAGIASPRVLIGGLGMAYTLRAALDALPPRAEVVVAELTAAVEAWCRGPLAVLTGGAVLDPRVRIVIDDVARVIAAAPPAHYHAIMLDLYEGPHAATQHDDDPFYGIAALTRARAALAPRGVLAIWSEEADAGFARRLATVLDVSTHRSGSSRKHVVYVGRLR